MRHQGPRLRRVPEFPLPVRKPAAFEVEHVPNRQQGVIRIGPGRRSSRLQILQTILYASKNPHVQIPLDRFLISADPASGQVMNEPENPKPAGPQVAPLSGAASR